MADLFERDRLVISHHLRNIFKDEEARRDLVVAKNTTIVAGLTHGQVRLTRIFYIIYELFEIG